MENPIAIEHITPKEKTLASIQSDFICERNGCNRRFKSISVLKFHELQYHDHRKPPKKKKEDSIVERFHCPVQYCIYFYNDSTSRYFAKLRYLKQHYLKVHSSCLFSCNRCFKSFSTKSFLRSHELYCGMDITCLCGQRFTAVSGLQTHVRRTKHESEFLKGYIYRKKEMKKEAAASKLNNYIQTEKAMEIKETLPALSYTASAALPKSEPPHLVAAIALSELAFTGPERKAIVKKRSTSSSSNSLCPILPKLQRPQIVTAVALSGSTITGFQRAPTFEVGIQTDPTPTRKASRKMLSPIRIREETIPKQKRKQTIEMETQTQLTNLKTKIKKKVNLKRGAKNTTGMGNIPPRSPLENINRTLNLNLSQNENSIVNCSDDNLVYKDIYNKDLDNNFNSLGTQTSVRVDLDGYTTSNYEYMTYDFFREDTRNKMYSNQNSWGSNIVKDSSKRMSGSYESLANLQVDELRPTSDLAEDVDDLISISPSGTLSPVISRRSPKLFSSGKSSSIETQTDHDVFLSNHVQSPDDVDDIILTSSETQTSENFSDIEPFLCSTIHTQTVDEHHSSSELFPELCSFTVDMQTQTRAEDNPNFITIHTQTNFKIS